MVVKFTYDACVIGMGHKVVLPLVAKKDRLLQATCRSPQIGYRSPQIYCKALGEMVSYIQKEGSAFCERSDKGGNTDWRCSGLHYRSKIGWIVSAKVI